MNGAISVKILFLAADPSDASRLCLGQELRDIKERLRSLRAIASFADDITKTLSLQPKKFSI